jgi:hypothetical protein
MLSKKPVLDSKSEKSRIVAIALDDGLIKWVIF